MQSIIRTLLLLGLISGCGRSSAPVPPEPSETKERQRIVVTSQPLFEMAEAVGQETFDVIRIIPDQTTSRDWKPRSEDVRTLQDAKLILINGAGYEPWRDRVSLPGSRLKDTAVGYYDQFLRIPDAVVHQHGPEGNHSHPGTVWATWLDPELAVSQLSQVTDAMIRLIPEKKAELETASAKLTVQLDSLNPQIAELAASKPSAEISVVSDGPYYHYLLNRLGWKISCLHWAETGDPTTENRDELLAIVKTLPESVPRIFLMSDRQSAAAEEFAREAGFTVVRIDLCEFPLNPLVSFVERMRGNLARLKSAIETRE